MSNKYNNDRDYLYDDNFSFIIGNKMQSKFNNLDHAAPGKSGDDLIKVRSSQLAAAKILVNIHERDPQLLIKAHIDLGEAYLMFKCYESAFDHLTIAYSRNIILRDNENFPTDQLRITKLLSKACLDSHRFERTIDYINESEELCENNGNLGQAGGDYAEVLTGKARFHYMQHELHIAYDIYLKVWEMYNEMNNGPACDGCVEAWIEIIKIDQETQQFDVAAENIQECIDVFKKIDFDNSKYTKDTLIDLYMQKIDI